MKRFQITPKYVLFGKSLHLHLHTHLNFSFNTSPTSSLSSLPLPSTLPPSLPPCFLSPLISHTKMFKLKSMYLKSTYPNGALHQLFTNHVDHFILWSSLSMTSRVHWVYCFVCCLYCSFHIFTSSTLLSLLHRGKPKLQPPAPKLTSFIGFFLFFRDSSS